MSISEELVLVRNPEESSAVYCWRHGRCRFFDVFFVASSQVKICTSKASSSQPSEREQRVR